MFSIEPESLFCIHLSLLPISLTQHSSFLSFCLIASQSSVVIGTSSPAFPQNSNNTAVNGTGKFLMGSYAASSFLSLNMQTAKPRPKITIQLLQLKLNFFKPQGHNSRSWISRGIF